MGGSSSKPQQVKQTPVGPQPTYHQARSQGLPQGNPYVQPAYYTGHGAKKAPVYYAAPQPYAVRPTSYYAAPAYRAPVVAPTYGYAPRPAAPVVATSQSSALALDAADGVIDGKFYGSPVCGDDVHARSQYCALLHRTALRILLLQVGVSAPTYAAPAPVTYAAPAYVAPTYAAPVVAGTQSSALALDAADGVIDGKYFGSQVCLAVSVAPGEFSLRAETLEVSVKRICDPCHKAVQPQRVGRFTIENLTLTERNKRLCRCFRSLLPPQRTLPQPPTPQPPMPQLPMPPQPTPHRHR